MPPSADLFYQDQLVTKDQVRLFMRGWLPEDTPRSVVALVHGYAEHSGRYAPLGSYLTQHHHAVYTYDQRGYGQSTGRRAYIDSFGQYVDDLHLILHRIRQQHPDLPLFLFGHSMGGAVATLYCLEQDAPLSGLILSSPALRTNEAPALQKIVSWVGRLLPKLPTVPLDRSLISRDPAVVSEANQDPLNYHGRVLARTGAELLGAMRRIESEGHTLSLPLLIFHGTDDQLTDPSASMDLYHRVRAEDKTLSLYDGLYHETFNEPEKAQVLENIADWLEEHLIR